MTWNWRRWRRAVLTVAFNAGVLLSTCCAQVPGQDATPQKSYVPSYIIIIFAVVIGLTAVCRMGKRSKEVRRPT